MLIQPRKSSLCTFTRLVSQFSALLLIANRLVVRFCRSFEQLKQNNEPCHVSEQNIKLSLLMYFSYFVLFARFFYKAYVDRRSPRKGAAPAPQAAVNGPAKKVQ